MIETQKDLKEINEVGRLENFIEIVRIIEERVNTRMRMKFIKKLKKNSSQRYRKKSIYILLLARIIGFQLTLLSE